MVINNTTMSTTSFFQSDVWLFCFYVISTYEIFFWFCNGFLLFIELFDIPIIDQYRIQKHKKKVRFQPDIVHLIIRDTIYHQISLFLLIPALYYIFEYFGHIDIQGIRPSWSTILFQLTLFMLSEDTIFFWTHRLFHTRWLYKHIHKKHHVYKQPTGLTAVLNDPFDDVQIQFASWFMPIFIQETHIFTVCIWVVIRAYQAINAHSGYNFPYISTQYWLPELMPGTIAHDFHHQQGKWNYGSFFSVWDQIMGTHRLTTSKKESN
ncbi:unnamed protein product [Adineta steineri]|uniref:Fatty acid hydroxylase domain-containing protein n=1 Tax=Adineta steineri TaxID=433720 RepID=A0A815IWZ1_9BILA|nr:unnamed protein product [Adineta steineri]CAF4135588.1 unnamed protein product [Adineta steineri]